MNQRVCVHKDWYRGGRLGTLLAVVSGRDSMIWGVVLWDDADDPDLHKFSGLTHVEAAPTSKRKGGA